MDSHQHQQQQQQQDHEDLLVGLVCDCWLEDDEEYDHEPVTVACACRHTMQYLSPRRAWTSDPYHHLPPPPPPFGVWEKERVLFAGRLCGILTTSLIYPIDVAKTLYQKVLLGAGSGHATRPPISFFQSGSYGGLAVSVVRSCLLNMIFFSNFEWLGWAGWSLTHATLPFPRTGLVVAGCEDANMQIPLTSLPLVAHYSLLLPVWQVERQVGAGGQDWDERDPAGPSV
ncbi:hypothetical protein KC316_g254 [Hortaea werneckii]|nr:hypothetical protein KC324_g299 [Hortaea werneckii]KAI7595849.1 hypothetical protein KC316_g254 [Hortaea werneckii]